MDYDNKIEQAIAYVRENKSWTKEEEELALSQIGEQKRPIGLVAPDIEDEINDLMEEFSDDNSLPEGWWTEYLDVDEIFWKL